ncbi:MAG: tetratricopeptide repeat protein [Edaphocola sp.]
MSDTIKTPAQEPHTHKAAATTVETPRDLQAMFLKNQKAIVGTVVALAVLVGGYFGYKEFIQKPNEEKAASALFSSERWFEVDSLKYVLNGDGQHQSAVAVAKKYSGTKAGNLACYYAGMAYLRTGDFKNAIKYLEDFDGKGTPLSYLSDGALGDAYMETNNSGKAIDHYKKAAANEKDNFISPMYLFRAALASEKAGKTDEAKKLYTELHEKFPNSQQGYEAPKYLSRLGEVVND